MATLGIDIDGVLADFNQGYVSIICDMLGDRDLEWGVGPKGQEPRRMKFSEPLQLLPEIFPPCWHYPQAFGYTEDQVAIVWRAIKKSPSFWRSLWPRPDANEVIDTLNRLKYEGHSVYFITDRAGINAKLQTEQWLLGHDADNPTVLLSADKALLVRGLGIDAYVDDRNRNVNLVMDTVREHSMLTRVYLFDAPYNRRPFMPNIPAVEIPDLDEFRDPAAIVVSSVEQMLRAEGLA